jgi:hypothetical protein
LAFDVDDGEAARCMVARRMPLIKFLQLVVL